jgi:hypothetical protein
MKNKKKFALFILAQVVTFGFITLLQFQSPKENLVAFILVLLAMHGGIAVFIVSKRLFKKAGIELKKFYGREYYFLLWYLPALFAKLFLPLMTKLTFAGDSLEYMFKLGFVVAITLVFAAESVFNDVRLYKFLSKENIK